MFAFDPGLIRLRPRAGTIYVSRGRTVLATGADGFLEGGAELGLFVHETRLLSRYVWTVDGKRPQAVAFSNVDQHSWLGYYILVPPGARPSHDTGSGQVPDAAQETLEMRVSRVVGEGIHEDVDLVNHTRQATEFDLVLTIDSDFADVQETAGERRQRGRVRRRWLPEGELRGELRCDYRARRARDPHEDEEEVRLDRGLTVRIEEAGSPPGYLRKRIRFSVRLPGGGTWHACILLVPRIDGTVLPAPARCRSFAGEEELDRRTRVFLDEATALRGPEAADSAASVMRVLQRARSDLASLRLFDLDRGDRSWVAAAGLPIYVALFGRDVLTTGWEAAMLGPEMMRGALEELPRWQGTRVDDWRDEQPGRMLHEAHTGPLAMLDVNPRRRYYGSVTTSGFYPLVLAELWHWTGDRELVARLVDPAIRALEWLDRDTDLHKTGFHEYLTRSPQGTRHQAWKDSADAIVDERGDQVAPPIATCEEQGFVYVAKLHLSEVLWWLDRKEEARRLFHDAQELKKRFNDAFWMEEHGTFAVGLAEGTRPIRSLTSNPGHCLASGIVEDERARRTAERLMAPDLFSGWGVRTLSSANPAYNPFSYHRGSVWPVEQATFALGFVRYGLHDLAEQIARAQFEASALFEYGQLPEVFSGHARDADHPFPAFYPRANSPQAWSASAAFCLIQSLLGLYPYAPLHLLLVDPHLPPWLPELTLAGLRVGSAAVSIRFFRRGEASDYEILDQTGRLYVVRQPSPWSLTASWAERLNDFLSSLVH